MLTFNGFAEQKKGKRRNTQIKRKVLKNAICYYFFQKGKSKKKKKNLGGEKVVWRWSTRLACAKPWV